MKKTFTITSYLFYGALLIYILFIYSQFQQDKIRLEPVGLVFSVGISGILFLFGTVSRWIGLHEVTINLKSLSKLLLQITFFGYLFCLTFLLFISFGYDRGMIDRDYTLEMYKLFYQYQTNFIPFKTIKMYLFDDGRYFNPGIAFKNLAGNIAAFAPLGLFLPLLFKTFRSWLAFILIAIFSPILVELIQFLTLRGSADIDDVLLNAVGALLMFSLFKIPPISKFIYTFFD
ncbi:MAG: VanZ family protein [Bacillales bacterium]|jgi:glycopeptide antibiotics resistance protein|nr:VanZ family protein [Bacillales bacterium]